MLQSSKTVPFTGFDASTGGLTVFTSDKALARIYNIKWKIEDPDSVSETSFVEVTFDLTVISICSTNIIKVVGNGIGDQRYYLGNDELTVSSLSAITTTFDVEKCPLTFSFYLKDT